MKDGSSLVETGTRNLGPGLSHTQNILLPLTLGKWTKILKNTQSMTGLNYITKFLPQVSTKTRHVVQEKISHSKSFST